MIKPNFRTLRVLVVDDEPMMRKLIKVMLNGLGVETVVLVSNGQDALDTLREKAIDIVTCDYNMDPMSGTELVRQIRRDHRLHAQKVPIVMVTANVDREVVYDARDSGANEYLVKPLSASALESRLHRALTDKRSFIDIPSYIGPDRRRDRASSNYKGPRRRKTDAESSAPLLGVEG